MSGEVGVLNVGAGDTKLSFDPKNPAERIRAARIVRDMLRRGYALLVKKPDSDEYVRALDFDENTCEYIIADFDPAVATAPVELPAPSVSLRKGLDDGPRIEAPAATTGAAAPEPPRRGRPRKRVPAESTNAVAVARTAGG